MDRSFGQNWGVLIDELKILSRAVFVLNGEGVIQYVEIVPEVTDEPDYEAAAAAVQKLLA
jgi:thiol peroxidase